MFDMDGLDYESIATELIGEPETHGEKNIRFECPYCHSYHKKFYLDTTRGIWNCYNCGEKGNIIKLIMNMLDCQYSNAIEYLKDWGAEYEDNQTIQNSIDENKSLYTSILQAKAKPIKNNNNKLEPVPLPTNFKYLIDNFNNPEAYPYLSYLKSRGITLQQIIDYKIGYVVDGYTQGTKMLSITKSIVFLTFDDTGKIIYWNTRSIVNKKSFKTINAPNDEYEYSKRDVIFNLDKIKELSNVILVESVFNAITVTFPPKTIGIATFGKKSTKEQLDLLKSKESMINRLYLFLDTDARDTQYDLAKRLDSIGFPSKKIYMVMNPYIGKDVNDLGSITSLELVNKAKPYKDTTTQLDYLLK